MEVEAHGRYLRITPRKARLVADTVVGLPVKDALTILDFTSRAAAREVAKVVKSAAANASNNFNQDEDALVVKRIDIGDGPTLKRGRPRARGMYFSIFKRTCHITAVVDTRALERISATTQLAEPTAPARAGRKRTAPKPADAAAPAAPSTEKAPTRRGARKKTTAEPEAKETT